MPQLYPEPQEPEPKPKPTLGRPAAVAAPVAAAAYDKPLPTQPGATLEPAAMAKYDYATTHARAQQLEVVGGRTIRMFDYIDPVAVKQIPFTLAHTTTANQQESLTYAVNDAVVWMNTVHGDPTLGALVLSNMITDPVSRDRTQAVLFDIASAHTDLPNLMAGQRSVNQNSDAAQAALQAALSSADPLKALDALDPGTQLAVKNLASQFYDSIQAAAAKGDPLADQFGRVVAVAQNGYTEALDPQQVDSLRKFVEQSQTGIGGTTQGDLGPEAASLGITQIRRLGEGQIVLDKDWAIANPDEALAERMFLEAQYPGAQIILGKQGILGSVLDKFGQTIDYATAIFGATAHQTGEFYQQITSGGSEEVNAQLTSARQAQQAYNSDGTVTPWLKKVLSYTGTSSDDSDAVQLAIDHVIDGNTFDVGLDQFWDDLKANTRPEMLGFGFADNVTRGQGLLPGDPAYNTAHTAIGIVSQFAFDPAMWGPAVLGGLRDAGVLSRVLGDVGGVPKIVDAAGVTHTLQVSNSAIHQATYARFARTADEVVQTRGFIRGAESMADVARTATSEGELATLLQVNGGMGIEESRRMANIIYPKAGMSVEEAHAASGIGLLDDAMATGSVDTVDRVYGIQAKLDEVNAGIEAGRPIRVFSPDTAYGTPTQDIVAAEVPHEAGYVYHVTNEDALREIRGNGLLPTQKGARGNAGEVSEGWKTFFGETPEGASSLADGGRGRQVVLRTRVEDVPGLQASITRNVPELFADEAGVAANKLEYWGSDGAWHPMLEPVPENVDLLAKKHTLESILQGNDSIHAATQGFIGGKQIRRLRAAAGLKTNAWDAAWEAVGRNIADFPANLFVRDPTHGLDSESFAELMKARPEAVQSSQVMFGKLGHLWREPGFGSGSEKFILEDATVFSDATGVQKAREALENAKATGRSAEVGRAQAALDSAMTDLVNTPNVSLNRLHNIAREHGISDARYRQMVEPYVSGELVGDLAGQRQWFFDTYDSIVGESKVYNGLAKKGARRLHETWVDDRMGSRLSTTGAEGEPTTEAVWTNKRADRVPYAMPTIDADLERAIPLPTLADFRSYATLTGRTMKSWEAAGGVRKAVSIAHGGLAREWRTVTSWWRSWILGSRILFALPARIVGEQQLRMAAFGYDSMVWHPSEWFDSTRGLWWHDKFFKDDAHLWDAAGNPVHALGTMVDDMRGRVPMLDKAVASVNGTIAGEQEAFFRSYSQMLTKYAASPSVKAWRLGEDGVRPVDEVRALMNAETREPLLNTWKREIELTRPVGDTRPASEIVDHALERWDQEMRQVIGHDPEDIVKRAILDRKVTIDGELYQVGTPQFATKLQELKANGRWDPGMRQLPRRLGDYLPGDKEALMKGLTQKLFKMFYSKPDLATSRVPLYRQIFQRNYDNFIKLGYDENRAIDVARSVAAETTADLLFQLGAHTNGEYLLREIMPFFPAYRELATTWVGRIPAHLGALEESHAAAMGWVLGAGALAERANLVLKSAEQLGIVHRQPDGTYYINAPLFGNILSWMTFGKVKFNAHVPLSSIAGLLPVPFDFSATDDSGKPLGLRERLAGALPSIGGPSVLALVGLKKLAPAFFGPVEDWLTLFGSDQSLGIPLIDYIWEGATHGPSPFVLGRSRRLHEATIQSAKDDGLRLAIHENPPPEFPGSDMTVEESKAYQKEWLAWRTKVLQLGDDYQQHLYLLKAGIGALVPFSVQFSDEHKAESAAMWEMLNHMPGGIQGEVGQAEMKLYLERNPGLEPWLIAKGQDHRLYDDPDDSLAAWTRAVGDGQIVLPDSNTYITYSMATMAFSEHMARVADIKSRAGDTWQEVLMNFDVKQELTDEQDEWNAFLDWNHNHMADLGIPDVKSMLDVVQQYKAIRAGKKEVLTLDQQRLIDFDQTMRHYARYFDYNPDTAGAYSKMRGAAYDALFKSIGAPSDISKGISRWFDKVADPYYTQLDEKYGSLKTAPKEDQETIYADIRKLSDHYDALARKSGDPTPESYVFAKKTPHEQEQTVAKWANLPGTWLTAFQRRQVGYEGDDTAVTKYSNYAAFTTRQMHIYMTEHDIGPGTTAEDDLKAQQERFLADKAKELGVTDTVHEMNAPTYVRVGHALNVTDEPGWKKLVDWRKQAESYLAAARGGDGLSLAGNTVEAIRVRKIFFEHAEELRQSDPALDAALNQIAVGLDEPTNAGLYDKLFFDITF